MDEKKKGWIAESLDYEGVMAFHYKEEDAVEEDIADTANM